MAVTVRQNRMERIVKMLKSASPADEVKFVATASYNIGVSMKKIREYVEVLEGMGVVVQQDGELVWLE